MWIERAVAILGLVGTLAGAWIWVDEHYASAADVRALRKELKIDSVEFRKKQIEDKIFELEFKRRQSPGQFKPLDGALLDRYNRELKDLKDQSRDLQRQQ